MKRNSDNKYYLKIKSQQLEELFFRVIMFLSSCIIILVLFLIIYKVLEKGIPSLSIEIITQTPKGGFYFGKEGGILNAIVGSLYLSLGAVIFALLIGMPIALYMNVWLLSKKKNVNIIRFVLDLLWGIPSIVYGAFGFTIMIATVVIFKNLFKYFYIIINYFIV